MARDSSGSKNQPQYSATGVSSQAADLSEVANYAATVGNSKAGTNATRLGLTGADVWDGLFFVETDTGIVYLRLSGGWVPWASTWQTYTPTVSGITLGTGGSVSAKWRYEAQRIRVKVLINLGTGTPSVGTLPTVTLPVTGELLAALQFLDGVATYYDNSAAGQYEGRVGYPSGDSTKVRLLAFSNSSGLVQAVTGGAPFAWAANDLIVLDFAYAF